MLSTAHKKSQSPTAETKDATPKAQTKSKNAAIPAYLQRKASGDEEQVARKQDTTEKAPEEKILDDEGISQPLVQRKLEVGAADDPMEKEADQVADAVVQNKPVPNISSADQQASRQSEEAGEQVQAKPDDASLQAKADEENVRPKEEEVGAQALRRQSDDTEVAQTLHRKTLLQAKGAPQLSDTANEQVEQMRGNGASLPDDVRMELQNKLGGDFSQVDIHNNPQANDLAKEINARAFTVGEDIFFAAGEYDPQSQEGKRLLSHELTHVVQQSGELQKKIQRDDDDTVPDSAGDLSTGLVDRNSHTISFNSIDLPAFKAEGHRGVKYSLWKQDHNGLTRHKDYSGDARENDQIEIWESEIEKDGIVEALRAKTSPEVPAVDGQYAFKNGRRREYYVGTLESIANTICRPMWDKRGREERMQVDHIVELQLSGTANGQNANIIENMELLKGSANASAGSTIAMRIASKVNQTYRNSSTKPLLDAEFSGQGLTGYSNSQWLARANRILDKFNIVFNDFTGRGGPRVGENDYWSQEQIERGDHVEPLEESGLEGLARDGHVMVFKSPTGGQGDLFTWNGTDANPRNRRERDWLYPWRIVEKHFNTNTEDTSNARLGHFILELRSNRATSSMRAQLDIDRFQRQRNVGGIDVSSSVARRLGHELRANHFSPIEFDFMEARENGLYAAGRVIPDIPFLQNCNLDIVIEDGEIKISKTFSSGEINVPSPFTISDTSLSVFLSSNDGLGIEGRAEFEIDRVGQGFLGAAASTEGGFALEGEFNFDERIFGEGTNAQVRMGYNDGSWSLGGSITIPEGKVPGVQTATIDVDYSQTEGFSASGEAELTIPGVERGTLEITQNEEEGFSIGGSFDLSSDTPGIRSGSISARVAEKEDGSGYAVSATGTAQPDIPGINSELTISYNDGAFTAEVTADYERGMLSGRLDAGVTNRSVDAETGELSETAEEGNPLVVYGGGSLTLQLAPWLQGTAGVRFSPNGEITVTGEIGLPDELEIFARREINKSIFNVAIQAPIVPGIVAEVGGGLGAVAGIGPGVIDELRLGVEYNPDREEDTRVTGDAHLNIPADAGLRLSVRAGIGLGITGASATGGLEIGGTLGIEGAAEAGVHVEWTPTQGLDIRANVGIHAQPSFTFDISGYVSVRALGFSVYDETWELASFSFGSDYRFGINLPIHYQEGQPFDISVNDIEFEVPNINTSQLLRSLISRIA